MSQEQFIETAVPDNLQKDFKEYLQANTSGEDIRTVYRKFLEELMYSDYYYKRLKIKQNGK